MEETKPISIPMVTCYKLRKDDEYLEVDHIMYRSMIGSLLHVTNTRLDVMQDAGLVARFQSTPKETHVIAVERILRYLKGTMNYGLWYPKRNNFTLREFTDGDWVGSIDDRKKTSGETFYLEDCLVSWLIKQQSSISLSIAEAEYIAAASCCTQVIWMKQTLEYLLVKYEAHPLLYTVIIQVL